MLEENIIAAPELRISEWINTEQNIQLDDLTGQVVAIIAFQMLCPGCVSHSLPQAKKMFDLFRHKNFKLIGLHCVFEHHKAMQVNALKAFIHEYRIPFPIGIDQASSAEAVPLSMKKFKLRGTPSLILIDKKGNIRLNYFGRIDDMHLGSMLAELLCEESPLIDNALHSNTIQSKSENPDSSGYNDEHCNDEHCAI
ncbi:MAG: peroxiredoxin [Flavobacteriales bacterium]|jgi:peroxiredoxin